MLQSENRSAKRIFFVEDFQVFGERYGIDGDAANLLI